MTHLVDSEGQLLNPTAALALLDDATLDALYDLFDPEAPLGWAIEHAGVNTEQIIVTGWKIEQTDEGYPWHTQHEARVTVDIPAQFKGALDTEEGLGQEDAQFDILGQKIDERYA